MRTFATPFIEDARSLISTAELCVTTTDQAYNLYTQAKHILTAIPREHLNLHESLSVRHLSDECDVNCNICSAHCLAVKRAAAIRRKF